MEEEEECEYESETESLRSEERRQKRRVEMGKEAVGGGGGGGNGDGGGEEAAGEAGRPDREILVKMDSQVLDCTICFEPLRPPIYQCEVGHAVCHVCRGKLGNTCPICCRGIGFSRCFALEDVVDTVKVPCANTNYGCKQFIIYYQKEKHEKTCLHAPCFCPEDGCSFKGSTGSLLLHFVTEHKWSPTYFHYDKAQWISIPRHCQFTLLVGEEDLSMFLVVNTFVHVGNALTMISIRPHEASRSCYSSEISVHDGESYKGRYVLQMDPHVGGSSLHDRAQLGRFFLMVPPELVDESTDELTINIRIEKIQCDVHH
ncbi:hypothetical protein PAHAL_5G456000 [Panicum hallii]|uniref:RING-type E3 ubiquitin transferase n=1 Tax=Panicum hallii TaxID=206008 RepID=A0A2S3HXC2_9POAL|nr:E3 ubiquitin-protein ligase SINA-like 7 isoform X1 [Panicum hallii]PAN32000.1 hypothetical protein PAHAL_5G456000 [Panicum hallii]PAN32001.1 hypothetical protein PAHAL_5G456000 [Panicum hallii]